MGSFVNQDQGEDTDEWALAHNYVAVVPCQYDLTAHHGLTQMAASWQLGLEGLR